MELRIFVFILLISFVSNSYGQRTDDNTLSYQLLSIELVTDQLYLLEAINMESCDSVHILVDKKSYMTNSLVFNKMPKNINVIIKTRLLDNKDLAKLFSFRKTEFCIFIDDREVITTDNEYYFFLTLIK